MTGTLVATDVDGLTDGSYFTISTPPVHGVVAAILPESGYWAYISGPTYVGEDPFTVTVTDDNGGITTQVINITVLAPDADGDTIGDPTDNCPNIANTDQADLDGDNIGDVCDDDKDGDGFDVSVDADDSDAYLATDPDNDLVDSTGEAYYIQLCLPPPGCDPSQACMTVCYVPPQDNCPVDSNSTQADLDGDLDGDACDVDVDGDNIVNTIEVAAGTNPSDPSDGDQAEQASVLALSVTKNVPAMGGFGIFLLWASLLGIGFMRYWQKDSR